MICPHCQKDITQGGMGDGYRDCPDCGGAHRIMETCPSRPGLLGLWRAWGEGERTMLGFLAVVGTPVLMALGVIAGIALTG